MYHKAVDFLWLSAKGLLNVSKPPAGLRQTNHRCSKPPAGFLPMLRQEWADLLQKGFSPIRNLHRWNREQAKQGHAPTLQNVLRKVRYHEAQDAKPVSNSIVFVVFYASWIPCRGTIGRFAGLYSWHRHLMKDTGNEKCQLALYNNNSIGKCKLTLNKSYRFISYHHDFCMFKTSLMLYAKYDRNQNNICLFNLFLMLTPITSCNCDV